MQPDEMLMERRRTRDVPPRSAQGKALCGKGFGTFLGASRQQQGCSLPLLNHVLLTCISQGISLFPSHPPFCPSVPLGEEQFCSLLAGDFDG